MKKKENKKRKRNNMETSKDKKNFGRNIVP